MCIRCTETEAEPCDVHGHDVLDAADVAPGEIDECAVCQMPGDEARAEMAARDAAWERISFALDRS